MKILFFGDIMGQAGRKAMTLMVPKWSKEHSPDLVAANVENLAHGKSVTKRTLDDIKQSGVTIFTSGNHIFKKRDVYELLENEDIVIPANYPPQVSGKRYLVKEIGAFRVFITNIMGRVFIKEDFDCPFRAIDEMITKAKEENADVILVDFHAEATSERMAFLYHTYDRISAIIGTHTHIATQDFGVYSGCGYVSDVGMVGGYPSVIGVERENVIKEFITQTPQKFEMADTKWAEVNAVLLDIDGQTKRTNKIEKLRQFVDLETGEIQSSPPSIEG